MKTKIGKIFIILFLCFIATCTKRINVINIADFILSKTPHIQNLEQSDHIQCFKLKDEFNQNNNETDKIYWLCRKSLMQSRLIKNNSSPDAQSHNNEIHGVLSKILFKIADAPHLSLLKENNHLDDRQHKECLDYGFNNETEDQTKIDKYFLCRKILMEKHKLIPPYGVKEYEKYQKNSSYNLGFIINRRIDKEIEKFEEAKKKYPTCVKFNLYSENFDRCVKSQNAARACFAQIPEQKFQKESDEKIICQKKAYLRFPDSFLKENLQLKKEIERQNKNSDYYNQHNFAALGIDVSMFHSPEDKEEDEEKLRQKMIEEEKEINSKTGLYNKFELTKLRQKFIFNCLNEADSKVQLFLNNLRISCLEMENFEILGED